MLGRRSKAGHPRPSVIRGAAAADRERPGEECQGSEHDDRDADDGEIEDQSHGPAEG